MKDHRETREERLANESMSAAQKSFQASMARESNDYSSSYSPDSNYYNGQHPYQQYQSAPQQPVMPKKRHHWGWLLWAIAAIIIFFGGVFFINNKGASDQNSQPHETKVIREVPKEQNQNNDSSKEDSKLQDMSKKLDDEMAKMKIDQSTQNTLLRKFQKQSADTQTHIYNMIQRYQNWIPTNGIKRTVLQHYLNRYNK